MTVYVDNARIPARVGRGWRDSDRRPRVGCGVRARPQPQPSRWRMRAQILFAGADGFHHGTLHALFDLLLGALAASRVRRGLLRTRIARHACGSPVYRLLLPPVWLTEPRASRNADCRDGQIIARPWGLHPPDLERTWWGSEGQERAASGLRSCVDAFDPHVVLAWRTRLLITHRPTQPGLWDDLEGAA